jgi:two-component system chemotaxis response regulator CheB
MKQQVQVLVVDDSALMRKLIPAIIERDTSIQVIGTAMDGAFALQKIEDLKPDVVTLDLEMPRMDGMEVLRAITRKHHVPIIVVSTYSTQGANATFKALALGAFDFVAKPRNAASSHMEEIATELIGKIKAAAESSGHLPLAEAEAVVTEPQTPAKLLTNSRPAKVVAIGVSTGGPNAVQYLLSQLPADFPSAIVIVQHMPEGFTETFARRLNDSCALDVHEARTGDPLLAGRVLICPGNRHMKVCSMPMGASVLLTDEDRVNGHRPSVEVLFHSVAQVFGKQSIGVLMTGMGDDGAEGLGMIKRAGGMTIAQSEDSCVVFGMPKVAIERGYALRVLPLESIANSLMFHSHALPAGVEGAD